MQEVCNDIKDINLDSVEKTLRTNLWQMIAVTKFAIPHMKRGDSIVNSCSVAGYMGNPQLVDYSATKGGIATWTRALAQQQAKKGIRVNAVAPGKSYSCSISVPCGEIMIDSMFPGIIWTPLQPATKGWPKSNTEDLGIEDAPLQRPGMPIEVATAYIFLASPLGTYFTGEVLHGTGGLEMQG